MGTARETAARARASSSRKRSMRSVPRILSGRGGGGGGGGARAFLVGLYVNGRADRERAAEGAGDAAADGTLLVGVRAVAGPTNETGRIPTGDDLESGRLEAPRGGRGARAGRGVVSQHHRPTARRAETPVRQRGVYVRGVHGRIHARVTRAFVAHPGATREAPARREEWTPGVRDAASGTMMGDEASRQNRKRKNPRLKSARCAGFDSHTRVF